MKGSRAVLLINKAINWLAHSFKTGPSIPAVSPSALVNYKINKNDQFKENKENI